MPGKRYSLLKRNLINNANVYNLQIQRNCKFYVERISNTEIEIMSLNKIWILMTNNRKTYNGCKHYNAYEKR